MITILDLLKDMYIPRLSNKELKKLDSYVYSQYKKAHEDRTSIKTLVRDKQRIILFRYEEKHKEWIRYNLYYKHLLKS